MVTITSLQGRRVKLFGGFDFIKAEALAGIVEHVGERALLVQLDQPLTYLANQFEHVVVQVCRKEERFDSLLFNGHVDCHCLWVPVDRFDPSRPLEVGWWRGSAAVVSTVTLAEPLGQPGGSGALLAAAITP